MRKLVSAFAIVAVILTMFPASVAAAAIGGCGTSGTGSYQSTGANNVITVATAMYAEIWLPGSSRFGPCSPNDNAGTNAASVNIGMNYGNAWLEAGVIICNHGDNGAWPATLCNGGRHWFVEQHGQFPWDYNLWLIPGTVPTGVTNTIEILYQAPYWKVYFNGVFAMGVDMGSGLVPTQSNGHYYQVETKDVGDGLGDIGTALNVGNMEYYHNGWIMVNTQEPCPIVSSQHQCHQNGAHGFYAYTTN